MKKIPTGPHVIIYVAHPGLRGIVKEALKDFDEMTTTFCEEDGEYKRTLRNNPKSWLMIDSHPDPNRTAFLLKQAQAESLILTRPIYLISRDLPSELVNLAMEYYVMKVRSGEISQQIIASDIQFLIGKTANQGMIHQVMPDILKYKATGRWDGALASLKVAQMSDPNNELIALEYADTQFQAGDYDQAIVAVEKILSKSPANLRALHIKARILMKKKKYAEAEDVLKEAEHKNHYHLDRLLDLGECLLHSEKFKEALEKFTQAELIDPESPEAKSGRAKAMMLDGEMDQALALVRNFSSEEQIAATLNSAAVIAMRIKQSDNAMQMYQQCIALLAKNNTLSARVWFNFGIAHHKIHDQAKAISCFETAFLLDPTFEDAAHNYHITAKVLMRQGKLPALNDKIKRPDPKPERMVADELYADNEDEHIIKA